MELFTVLGEEYYLDIDNISSSIKLNTTIDELLEQDTFDDVSISPDDSPINRYNKSDLIDVTKWEIIKHCIEVIFNETEVPDEKMGKSLSSEMSIPFRLAFNTLIKNKIIKKNG